jgi:putative mRNA 3-end processing factor
MAYEGRFLGAAEDIGRLGFILEAEGSRFLFDYGIAPEKPPLYPLEAPSVDQVFLTHAHLDHSGMIPWLVGRSDASIITTAPTAGVSTILHRDSLKIARQDGFPEPYTDQAIEDVQQLYQLTRFGEETQVGPFSTTLHSAGHIPGAAMMRLEGKRTVLFTGDLYTRPQRLVGAGKPVSCDILCIETTYAGREHPDRDQTERDFVAFCQEVADRGGITIAAAFAVGRAQELAMVLAGSGLNVWLDGMGRAVADVYGDNPAFLADPAAFGKALGETKKIWNHRGRDTALREADVIITTSGMLEGGPVLYYLDRLRNDPRSAVALTGYQVRGTNGRRLMDEGVLDMDPMRSPGERVHPINCEIRHFDFSAHAGHSDLVAFAEATGAEDIVLFHGDNREALVPDLSKFARVHLPMRGVAFSV